MFGIARTPPCTRAFHPLLNNVAVSTFNFTRPDGQFAFDCVLVVEVLAPVAQVTVTLPHGSLAVLCLWRFKVSLQLFQNFIGLVGLEPNGLFIHPFLVLTLWGDNGLARSTEVVTGMKEIDQVTAL